MDHIFLIRALSLYVPLMGSVAVWKWRKPAPLEATGALLATAWNLPTLLVLNVAARALGWWRFNVHGAVFLGVPVDLWLGWSVLWGAFAVLVFPRAPIWLAVSAFGAADLILMPLCSPVVVLGPRWLAGEVLGLALCLLPALLFARWTRDQVHVCRRAFLQFLTFSAIFLLAIIMALSFTGRLPHLTALTSIRAQIIGQLVFLLALPGLSAVQEFATVGQGTPLPFDPPRKLVTSGIYSYLANPMQTSTTLLLLGVGLALRDFWLVMAAATSFAYCAGLAAWDEGEDLKRRHGGPFVLYRHHVRDWLPRWRPYVPQAARLYLSEDCGKCSQMAGFVRSLHPVGLEILPAEEHPTLDLERMTYESHDGSVRQTGVAALAWVFEHVNLAWALLGMAMRLPLIVMLLQAIADVSGGEPVLVRRRGCSLDGESRLGSTCKSASRS